MKKSLLLLLLATYGLSTTAQTTIQRVDDLNKTPKDSDFDHAPVEWNGKLYFGAVTKAHYQSVLHVYDGSTVQVAPGVAPTGGVGTSPGEMVVYKNKLYFNGYQSWKGNELMVYDGINQPTMVADIYSTGQASSSPKNFYVYMGKLYFNARTATGENLYSYDGTNPPVQVNSSVTVTSPRNFIKYNNKLYFTAYDGSDEELYELDGSITGSDPIKRYNINETTGSSSTQISSQPTGLVVWNDTLYFGAKGTDGINELYRFTQDDSFQLARTYSGAKRHTWPKYLTVFNGKLYYQGIPRFGAYSLIEYDGINDPTEVYDLNNGSNSYPKDMIVIGSKMYFTATNSTTGYELYVYDGNNNPTLVTDMIVGTTTSNPQFLTKFNNDLVYLATDTITGRELRTIKNGTSLPSLIHDFSAGTEGSYPQKFTEFNDKLYFAANVAPYGNELWSYDGTNPPSLVSDFNSQTSNSIGPNYPSPVVYNNKLHYFGELWSNITLIEYDGTTTPKAISSVSAQNFKSTITDMIVYKGKIYFDGFNFTTRRQLYVYDGDTTTLLHLINPTSDASPSGFFIFNDKMYFTATNGTDGYELWVYDGTNNPSMVANINTTSNGNSYPNSFQELNGKLYFLANNGTDTKIFMYDGNNAPQEISQGNLRAHQYLSKHNNKLYFYAWNGSVQPEPYVYDGVNPPTLLADINPGSSTSNPTNFTSYHGKLYFSANNGVQGSEMFVYDGTDTSSFDIYPGEESSYPTNFFVFKGKMYFSATTGDDGYELWSLEAPDNSSSIGKEIATNVMMYPNPANNRITVELENQKVTTVKIYDLSGKEVLHSNDSNVDVSSLTNGVYIVTIESDDSIGYAKLSKGE